MTKKIIRKCSACGHEEYKKYYIDGWREGGVVPASEPFISYVVYAHKLFNEEEKKDSNLLASKERAYCLHRCPVCNTVQMADYNREEWL